MAQAEPAPQVSTGYVVIGAIAVAAHAFVFFSLLLVFVYPILIVAYWWLASRSEPVMRTVWSLLAGVAIFFELGLVALSLVTESTEVNDPLPWAIGISGAATVWFTSRATWRRRART